MMLMFMLLLYLILIIVAHVSYVDYDFLYVGMLLLASRGVGGMLL